jgi:hypothetical protein
MRKRSAVRMVITSSRIGGWQRKVDLTQTEWAMPLGKLAYSVASAGTRA